MNIGRFNMEVCYFKNKRSSFVFLKSQTQTLPIFKRYFSYSKKQTSKFKKDSRFTKRANSRINSKTNSHIRKNKLPYSKNKLSFFFKKTNSLIHKLNSNFKSQSNVYFDMNRRLEIIPVMTLPAAKRKLLLTLFLTIHLGRQRKQKISQEKT